MGAEGLRKQIENTNDAIEKITGKRPSLMRPPYGATSSTLNRRFTEDYRLKVILWSVDPLGLEVSKCQPGLQFHHSEHAAGINHSRA